MAPVVVDLPQAATGASFYGTGSFRSLTSASRFDLENKLLEGELRVSDLPEAWHAAMQADLGMAPSGDRDGCLQDAHWYSSYIGGQFRSYAIGNILSAQFYAAALKAHPDIPREIASGEFGAKMPAFVVYRPS
jgi:Zn-dependent M32 family carboxypeptidase